jgi:hypothetical protein
LNFQSNQNYNSKHSPNAVKYASGGTQNHSANVLKTASSYGRFSFNPRSGRPADMPLKKIKNTESECDLGNFNSNRTYGGPPGANMMDFFDNTSPHHPNYWTEIGGLDKYTINPKSRPLKQKDPGYASTRGNAPEKNYASTKHYHSNSIDGFLTYIKETPINFERQKSSENTKDVSTRTLNGETG